MKPSTIPYPPLQRTNAILLSLFNLLFSRPLKTDDWQQQNALNDKHDQLKEQCEELKKVRLSSIDLFQFN